MSLSAEKTALKTALETYGKTIDLEIKYGETTFTSQDIVSFIPSHEGSILTAIMKQAEIELDGVGGPDFAESMKGQQLSITLTVTGGETTASKEYGTFIVKDAEYKDETNSVVLTCYDLMLLAMTEYKPVIEFPVIGDDGEVIGTAVTLGVFLNAMCEDLGIVLATPTFVNSDVVIDEEKYDTGYTKRDVLTEIAQAAGGMIAIKNDQLYVLYPTDSEVKIEPSNLKSIKIGELYGPVNSVVLARTPQEDNIFKRDESAEKICEIKIENNQIMDSHREDFIEGLYNALYGLSYHPHEIESFGIGILDIGDLFTVETLDGKTYTVLHLSGEVQIDQGFIERSKGAAPAASETEYKAASESDRRLNKTILRVDKQEQTIQSLVTKTASTEEATINLSSLIEATAEAIRSEVSETYITNDDMTSKIATEMKQTKEAFDFSFMNMEKVVGDNKDSADAKFNEISKYIRFEDGNIILGESGNELTLKIENDRISFLDAGAEVAYFSNKQLYVTDAHFFNSVRIGSFAWIPRENGNLSLVKVGG